MSADKPQQDDGQVVVDQASVAGAGTQPITCGLIMPIASNDGGTAEHWRQVREIITSAISSLNLRVQMVSESEAVNVIHKNIVQNIFANEIVICDVSSRNPNVMFELGMRLAFDKPVVIIKDRDTPFSFDIGNMQHIEYPHSLNYIEILSFQEELLNKVKFTMNETEVAKSSGGKYSPFLSNYAITEVSEIKIKHMDKDDYIIGKLNELTESLRGLSSQDEVKPNVRKVGGRESFSEAIVKDLLKMLSEAEKEGLVGSLDDAELLCKEALEFRYSHLSHMKKEEMLKQVINKYMFSII